MTIAALPMGIRLGALLLAGACGSPGLHAAEQMSVPGIGITLVKIPHGKFIMGHSAGYDNSESDERPGHAVTITKDYWLGATDVTVAQFRYFVETTGYTTEAEFGGVGILTNKTQPKVKGLSWRIPGIPNYTQTDDGPVLGISWADAMQFCTWLTERERSAGRLPEGYVYRLPTEAQWEYAARFGTTDDAGYWRHEIDKEDQARKDGKPVTGDARAKAIKAGWKESDPAPGEFSWYVDNAGGVPHPVAQKKPNPWGLYDMIGNVWNWVYDWYGRYPDGPVTDPQGPLSPNDRTIIKPLKEVRGASWKDTDDPKYFALIATNRWSTWGVTQSNWVSFRIALTTIPPPPPPGAGRKGGPAPAHE